MNLDHAIQRTGAHVRDVDGAAAVGDGIDGWVGDASSADRPRVGAVEEDH